MNNKYRIAIKCITKEVKVYFHQTARTFGTKYSRMDQVKFVEDNL